MFAAQEQHRKFTPEEYFVWEEQQQIRHKLIDREVYAMTGGTINHSEIASNFNFLLKAHLQDGNCRVLNSDARVNIYQSNNYTYLDLSVTCDDRDRQTTQYISYRCLVAEVLSASTEVYDQNNKFKLYHQSPSLIDYVLVSANKIEVDVYPTFRMSKGIKRKDSNKNEPATLDRYFSLVNSCSVLSS